MKRLFLLFLTCSLFLVSCGKSKIQSLSYDAATQKYSCLYKNQTRRFLLCLPPESENPAPLIFMLHGYGGDATSFKNETQFNISANNQGFAVVYVNGIANPDVAGSSSGWLYGNSKHAKNDIDFLEALARFLQIQFYLDSKRTYAVGFSNGAFMCTKLALMKADTFRAVVSVGGMMPENVWDSRKSCKTKPAAFLQINGTKDDVTPMKWNNSSKYNPNPAIEDVLGFFVDQSLDYPVHLPQKSLEPGFLPEHTYSLSDRSTLYQYSSQVWWLLIEGGAHNWPTERWSGFKVDEVILDFFR